MSQKETKLEKAAKKSLKEIEQQYGAAINAAVTEAEKSAKEIIDREERLKKLHQRMDSFLAKVAVKESKPHRVSVDFGGGTIAQVSTELLNWGVRALGDWSHDGFWAHNVDILQGAPQFVLGLGLYFAEMITRDDPTDGGKLPSARREVMSEAAKLFSQLGFANLMRAIRVRYSDGKRDRMDMQALMAERDELRRRLAGFEPK